MTEREMRRLMLKRYLKRYDAPIRHKVLQTHPEYISNPNEYDVDLIPKDPNSGLPCIELMVCTQWYGEKKRPSTIFIRKRKRRHMHEGVDFWIFSVGLKKYAFINGRDLATAVSQLPLSCNPHDADDQGYFVDARKFVFRQL